MRETRERGVSNTHRENKRTKERGVQIFRCGARSIGELENEEFGISLSRKKGGVITVLSSCGVTSVSKKRWCDKSLVAVWCDKCLKKRWCEKKSCQCRRCDKCQEKGVFKKERKRKKEERESSNEKQKGKKDESKTLCKKARKSRK